MALFSKSKPSDPQALMKAGDFKGAVKLLQQKLKQNPNDFATKIRLAEAFEGAGRREDAVRIYIEEGEANISGGTRVQGLALLKKALKLSPGNEDLSKRVSGLETQASSGSSSGAFSFDMDVSEEAAPAPAEEVEETAPQPEAAGEETVPPPEAVIETPPAPPQEVETLEPPMDEAEIEEPMPEVDAADLVPLVAEAPERPAPPPPKPPAPPPPAPPPERPPPPPPPPPETSIAAEPPASRLMRADDPQALMQELFPGLSPEDALRLTGTLHHRKMSTGDVLLREGETGDSLFLVMEGTLEATGRFANTSLRLALLKRCDVIGEVAFLKGVPRTATVIATEPSVVLELSREATRERFQDSPALLSRLEAILEERVEKTISALKSRVKDA